LSSPARPTATNKAADTAPYPQAHRTLGAVSAAVTALHIEELQLYSMDFVHCAATQQYLGGTKHPQEALLFTAGLETPTPSELMHAFLLSSSARVRKSWK